MMKVNRKNKRVFNLFLLLLVHAFAFGQVKEFKYRATLSKIKASDVYKIELRPALIAKCAEKGLYDIRLVDGQGKFVAYTITDEQVTDAWADFVAFPQVPYISTADTGAVYIAENKQRLKVTQLRLRIKNTAVERRVTVEGSDDLQHWFAVKEDINLQPAGIETESEYSQLLTLPTSDYRYFKIIVSGKNKTPVKILGSGVYVINIDSVKYSALPQPKFNLKSTDKVTNIYASFDEPYLVNKIHLDITGPKFYSRKVTVYDVDAKSAVLANDVLVSSSGTQDIPISAKTSHVRITISNGDDNPLTVAAIRGYQQKQYAVSYLEAGKKYYLLVGDSSAHEVSYDLTFLGYRPPAKEIISHSEVGKNPAYLARVFTVKRDYTMLIWVSITIVLVLLSLLTWRMVKELGTK
jgi:hypothetical protein